MSNRVRPTKSTTRARPTSAPDDAGGRVTRLVVSIGVAVLVFVVVVVALLAFSGSDDDDDTVVGDGAGDSVAAGGDAALPAQDLAFAQVELAGDPLPPFEGTLPDPAVGLVAPAIRGFGPDGIERAFANGEPRAMMFVAHWCSHCQDELDAINEYLDSGGTLPDGVEIQTVATWSDPGRANFPPGEWLVDNNWLHPTIVDDEAFTLATSLGLTGTPMWIFVDADGTVVERSGALAPEDLVSRMESLVAA